MVQLQIHAPVAQWIRASVFGTEGRRFESYPVYQNDYALRHPFDVSLFICYTLLMAIKKQKARLKIERVWFVIAVLAATQVITLFFTYRLYEITTHLSKQAFDSILVRAEERRYSDPVIDIAESKVYIPEARVYLPLNEISRNVVYNYRTSSPNLKQLILSTKQVVGMQPDQSTAQCDQVVILSNLEIPVQSKEQIEIKVTKKDGIKYLTTLDASCENLYSKDTRDKLIDLATKIESY